MSFNQKNGWRILPAGGNTGMAYVGIREDKKIFLKRNTSPFLAALSIEGITPKLKWTKRMASGDILTAQEWMSGRCLYRMEMSSKEVSDILYRVHHSSLLKKMLQQVKGKVLTPQDLLNKYQIRLVSDLSIHPLLQRVASGLGKYRPQLEHSNYSVCHGDLNHKNWLLSDKGQLYLVDWDSAKLADPAYDIGMLICQYVPRSDWNSWLNRYYQGHANVLECERVYWYVMMYLLLEIQEYHRRGHFTEMNRDIVKLSEVVNEQPYFKI